MQAANGACGVWQTTDASWEAGDTWVVGRGDGGRPTGEIGPKAVVLQADADHGLDLRHLCVDIVAADACSAAGLAGDADHHVDRCCLAYDWTGIRFSHGSMEQEAGVALLWQIKGKDGLQPHRSH